MKIAFTSKSNNLESEIDPRFGRCQNFILVDTKTLEFETIKNPNSDASGGAGIVSGQLVASKHIKAVITGNVGPNAFQTLQSAGIDVVTGISCTVKEAIEKNKTGELKPTGVPSVNSKFGMPPRK